MLKSSICLVVSVFIITFAVGRWYSEVSEEYSAVQSYMSSSLLMYMLKSSFYLDITLLLCTFADV